MNSQLLGFLSTTLKKEHDRLLKKEAKLQADLEEGKRIENLSLFIGSINSAPLKAYVETHLEERQSRVKKAEQELEKVQARLKEIGEYKDGNPQLVL